MVNLTYFTVFLGQLLILHDFPPVAVELESEGRAADGGRCSGLLIWIVEQLRQDKAKLPQKPHNAIMVMTMDVAPVLCGLCLFYYYCTTYV